MAITLISSPEQFAPAYNPMQYVVDSDNKNLNGFRYIIDLKRSDDDSLIKRLRVTPRIIDGYGIVDVSKALQTYLTHERPWVTSNNATASYIGYYIQFGEEYSAEWAFDRWSVFTSTGPQNQIWNNRIFLTTKDISNVPHPFTIGNTVQVSIDDPNSPLANYVSGLTIVGLVQDSFSFVIPKFSFFKVPLDPYSGTVKFADGRTTTLNLAELTLNNRWAFNSAWPTLEWPNFVSNNVRLLFSSPNKRLLSNIPLTFSVTPNTRMVLNVPNTFQADGPRKARFTSSNGIIRVTNLDNTGMVMGLGVGPNNLPSSSWSGGSSTFLDEATTYQFWIEDAADRRCSSVYIMTIDDVCSKYPVNEIQFLDRKGSLGSFYFPYLSKGSTNITREKATFVNGAWTTSGNLGLYDGGKKWLSVTLDSKFEVTTAWLTRDQSDYFQELLTSPVTFLSEGTKIQEVLITNPIAENKQGFDDKNIRYKVTMEMSNNNIINW